MADNIKLEKLYRDPFIESQQYLTCLVRDLITSIAALFFSASSLASLLASFKCLEVISSSASRCSDLRVRSSTYMIFTRVSKFVEGVDSSFNPTENGHI